MALKTCTECGKEISDSARRCPHCGKYLWTGGRMGCVIVFLLLFAVGMIGVCSGPSEKNNSDRPTTKQSTVVKDPTPLTSGGETVKYNNPGWTNRACNAVADKKIFIGMDKDQVIAAWGKPHKINTTMGSFGTHEQWVMYDLPDTDYVYFENGILKSIQQSH